VLAQLGSRSEQLTQFGVTPIRKGIRKKVSEKKPQTVPASPDGQTSP
jgi:hypothetical protein